MKSLRFLFAAVAAFCFALTVFAAEASPAGSWKWTITPPSGDRIEISAQLEFKDGKLSGNYQSPFGAAPISQASFKNGEVVFSVEREFDGNKFVVKYAGKPDGDAIRGTVQLPGFDGGEPSTQEWNAKRVK